MTGDAGEPIRLLVDGLFFQTANTGISRVWHSILPELAVRFETVLLDRGNAPTVDGVTTLPFAAFVGGKDSLGGGLSPTAAESIAIEELCRLHGIDVFASTYYSTPLSTPTLALVHDMIPELMGWDLSQREWQEKELAILMSRGTVCVSANTRTDLLRLYPEIDPERVTVAYCGVDHGTFQPRDGAEVARWREANRLEGPYLMMVGTRMHKRGYKNVSHALEALSGMPARTDLTVLCTGGEPEPPHLRMGGRPVRTLRLSLTDEELALAYSGAEGLVYPSLYEGFGMPVIEAMACGCPVVTTSHGSLAEVAGDAALLVSGHDVEETRAALTALRDPATRARLSAAGLARASEFHWGRMATQIGDRLEAIALEGRQGVHSAFLSEWARLRRIQAEVDS